jgi:uroporphyrin-III C-methyltransferase
MKGKVYLVGAGPGDPELLTVKAQRILRQADVVLHDELVSGEVLGLVRPSARVQNVGKRCGRKNFSQEEIHSLMVHYACEGLMVTRLKGGDPLVFGRANEEMAALRACGIEFEIIPGVTAALAAAASAKISLTDRRTASRVTFLTNHLSKHLADGGPAEKTISETTDGDPAATTVVVYMPGADYELLARRLEAAGLKGDSPCAIVSRASMPEESVYCTTVAELAKIPRLAAPCLVIAGAVAAAANWPSSEAEEKPEALFEVAACTEEKAAD